MKENYVKLELRSLGENVAIARMTLSSFLMPYDLRLDELDEIKIALSEAVSNSIIHGYGGSEDGLVRVIFEVKADKLYVTVEDDGAGIGDVAQAMEPAYSSKLEHMGLGFVFMQTFMEEVAVTSEIGRGTRVVMAKRLPAQDLAAPAAI